MDGPDDPGGTMTGETAECNGRTRSASPWWEACAKTPAVRTVHIL